MQTGGWNLGPPAGQTETCLWCVAVGAHVAPGARSRCLSAGAKAPTVRRSMVRACFSAAACAWCGGGGAFPPKPLRSRPAGQLLPRRLRRGEKGCSVADGGGDAQQRLVLQRELREGTSPDDAYISPAHIAITRRPRFTARSRRRPTRWPRRSPAAADTRSSWSSSLAPTALRAARRARRCCAARSAAASDSASGSADYTARVTLSAKKIFADAFGKWPRLAAPLRL